MSPDTNLTVGERKAGLQQPLRTPKGTQDTRGHSLLTIHRKQPQGLVWTWVRKERTPLGSRNFLSELTAASRNPAFFSANLISQLFTVDNKQVHKFAHEISPGTTNLFFTKILFFGLS